MCLSDLMVIWGLCLLHVECRVGEWEEEENVLVSRNLTERKRQNIVCVCVCLLPERVMGFSGIHGCD